MTTKKPTQQAGNGTVWVNYDLNADEKVDMKKQFSEPDRVFAAVTEMAESGYRVVVQYENFSKGITAMAFPVSDDNDNTGKALSGRGSDAFSALRGLVYRHYVVFKENWSRSLPPRSFDD